MILEWNGYYLITNYIYRLYILNNGEKKIINITYIY